MPTVMQPASFVTWLRYTAHHLRWTEMPVRLIVKSMHSKCNKEKSKWRLNEMTWSMGASENQFYSVFCSFRGDSIWCSAFLFGTLDDRCRSHDRVLFHYFWTLYPYPDLYSEMERNGTRVKQGKLMSIWARTNSVGGIFPAILVFLFTNPIRINKDSHKLEI